MTLALILMLSLTLGTSVADEPSPRVCAAFMLNASGVWGGVDAFLTPSGEFWVRRWSRQAAGGMKERRYRLTLSPDAVQAFSQFVTTSGFMRLKNKKRRWIPDEPRVLMGVAQCGNTWLAVERSTHEDEARFRAVYFWFLQHVRAAEETPLVYEGEPDNAWRPHGLPPTPEWHW